MNHALELALELHSVGLAPIPIIPGTKRPTVKIRTFFETGPQAFQLPILFDRNVEVAVLGGKPSDRLAIIDCDNEQSAARMMDLLHDPDTWIVKSLRGLHIYTRTPVPVKSTRGDGFDLQAQAKYCLAPGALHPQGVIYEFLKKSQRILELPSLDSIPGLTLTPSTLRPQGLPRNCWRLLTQVGAWKDFNYATRSEAEYAVTLALINIGCDATRVLSLFSQYAHPDTHFRNLIRDRGVSVAEDWLQHRVYEPAVEYARTHANPELQMVWQARYQVERQSWTGRAGAYNRAVLLGHIGIAEQAGRLTYQASVRDLAERAGVSIKSVSKTNQRLARLKLIEPVKPAYGVLATQWRLGIFGAPKGNTPKDPSVGECYLLASRNKHKPAPNLGHDVFRWVGLGKCAAQVWHVLTSVEQPPTARDLAMQTGRGARTIERILSKMLSLGMVRCELADGVVWSAVASVNLDDVARELGVAGLGAQQRTKHARERAQHQKFVRRMDEQNGKRG